MPLLRRRAVLSVALAASISAAAPAPAQTPDVALFKIVSPKDEIVVGLARADVAAMGTGPAVELLAKRIAQAGQLALWQYAPRRDAQGVGRMTPVQRVVVFASGIVRIEPHAVDGPVLPPPN